MIQEINFQRKNIYEMKKKKREYFQERDWENKFIFLTLNI